MDSCQFQSLSRLLGGHGNMEIIPNGTVTLFSSTAGKLIGEKGQGLRALGLHRHTGDWRTIELSGTGTCRIGDCGQAVAESGAKMWRAQKILKSETRCDELPLSMPCYLGCEFGVGGLQMKSLACALY